MSLVPGLLPDALLLAIGGLMVLFVAWRRNALRRQGRELRLLRQEQLASEPHAVLLERRRMRHS